MYAFVLIGSNELASDNNIFTYNKKQSLKI